MLSSPLTAQKLVTAMLSQHVYVCCRLRGRHSTWQRQGLQTQVQLSSLMPGRACPKQRLLQHQANVLHGETLPVVARLHLSSLQSCKWHATCASIFMMHCSDFKRTWALQPESNPTAKASYNTNNNKNDNIYICFAIVCIVCWSSHGLMRQ